MTPDEYQAWAQTKWNGKGFQCEWLEDVEEGELEYELEVKGRIAEMMNAALGISGEAGEFADLMKKWAFHQLPLAGTDKIEKELGDLLYYIAQICNLWGSSLQEIMERNVRKLNARYPEGFDVERSNNRNEGQE